MPPIKHRQSNPSYLVAFGEIDIPDDGDLGRGSFATMLKPNALVVNNVINSQMVNVPVFQISVNINNSKKEISVLLGKADGSDPLSRRIFQLPGEIDLKPERLFLVRFKEWQVVSMELNGKKLKEVK